MTLDATAVTRERQRRARASLPLADRQAFEDAHRVLVESAASVEVMGVHGRPVWTLRGFSFLQQEEAPATVHPGLWRHARLNTFSGLFKVTEGMYQVRGLDLANMTLLEGDTGVIVVDPLTSVETARAALDLYFRHRPRRPVVAVIYTHSHVDHFGGVRGVVDEAEVKVGRVQVIAPAGFMEEAVAENVLLGPVMSRRALFQFGTMLPRGERGTVDAGLGKAGLPGTVSLIAPTRLIEQPEETVCIDGREIVFELTPGAEAPAEMILFHPRERVLNMAEIVTSCMHNLLPMRGAQVRDPLAWSRYIGRALHRYGERSDVLIAQHHWPVWGSERLRQMLRNHRDAYKYLHDQTVRLMNLGYVGSEIAEMVSLPASLAQDWSVHPFYGHLGHNIRAIYQRYLGYYEANPAQLEALPPVAAARKTVAYMGGAQAVLQRAREDFERGEYRWVAQVMSQSVFADPSDQQARALGADALEQLGYQSESATARNAFLQGAAELRHGLPKVPGGVRLSPDLVRALPLDLFFDYLGVRLDGPRAEGLRIVLNWDFTDTGQQYVLNLENCALTHLSDAQDHAADASLVLTRSTLDEITMQRIPWQDAIAAGRVRVVGNVQKVQALFAMIATPEAVFPVVEPRAQA